MSVSSQKVDLSYVNTSRREKSDAWHKELQDSQKATYSIPQHMSNNKTFPPRPYKRLLLITSLFVEAGVTVDNAENPVNLEPTEVDALARLGYNITDVKAWATIIVDPNPRSAVDALMRLRDVPHFMITLFLRRKQLGAYAFNVIFCLIWEIFRANNTHKIRAFRNSTTLTSLHHTNIVRLADCNQNRRIDNHAMKIIIIRLIRHARQLPLALQDIVTLLTAFLEQNIERASSGDISHITFYLNRCLRLIGTPTVFRPFDNASVQANAQFDLIRFMASRNPPIIVTQEGYRALIKVQLAMKKTAAERRWGSLKRESWPPWKENKTALDQSLTIEGGMSTAGKMLRLMLAAGYAPAVWEHVAKLHAGWDTDNSPAIQTRTLIQTQGFAIRPLQILRPNDNRFENNEKIWAARLKATRTIREAWACYLTYKKRGCRASHDVSHEMSKKIIHSPPLIRSSGCSLDEQRVIAGDRLETFPDPVSPYRQVHVARPPPSLEEFCEEVLSDGIKPKGRFLETLLRGTQNAELIWKILDNSGEPRVRDAFISSANDSPYNIPRYLYSAWIEFLCSQSGSRRVWTSLLERGLRIPQLDEKDEELLRSLHIYHERPLCMILRILLKHKPRYARPWHLLLQQLGKKSYFRLSPLRGIEFNEKQRCHLMEVIVQIMSSIQVYADEETLLYVCQGISTAAEMMPQHSKHWQTASHGYSNFIRSLFQEVVFGMPIPMSNMRKTEGFRSCSTPVIDSHIFYCKIPGVEVLHAYVRALGHLHDFEGLYSFINTLALHHKDLDKALERNWRGDFKGDKYTSFHRKVIIPLRSFLEPYHKASAADGAPEELMLLVQGKVESISMWGPWPSDDDIRKYREEPIQAEIYQKHD
jgi:hypothetical protein